ncbi:MAG TPA: PBP1A family penicillin-binding protein [Myxococcaceae bacterium]|nr:PBP1A family penicillin-binding protein [Myxococcaceae bacterium]
MTAASTPSPESTPSPASRKPRGRLRKWFLRLVLGSLALLLLLVLTGVGVYLYFDRDLPSVEALRSYRPPQVSKVYCSDGKLCAEFYKERRTWVQIETLPKHVRDAFLAAEDADFYKHEGLDFVGMTRAALKGLIPGKHMTGASTITQQACRNLLLSQERTLSRKIREWILTPRLEKTLTKDQILNLYVNQIFFGHNRYGIEEASLFYFGKHAKDLTLGEAAVLAGTPQLPHRINPLTNIVKAKKRQKYVLTQLARHNFLPQSVVDAEMDKPIVLAPRAPDPVGPYYVEEVRKMLVARYGEEAVMEGGLRVDIAMDPKLQGMADASVRAGLEAVDRRHGYKGALGTMDKARFDGVRKLLESRIAEAGKRRKDEVLLADLSKLAQAEKAAAEKDEEANPATQGTGEDEEEVAPPSTDELLARKVDLKPLEVDARLGGYVTAVDDAKKTATVDVVTRSATIAFDTVKWARPRSVGKWTQAPQKMSDVMKPGDLVRIRVLEVTPGQEPLKATLDQLPDVQGGLVVIDPSTRYVVAMVGGYDFTLSAFNRATQAKRQPGSSFKPFLYAAALATQQYTPLSVINDAPEAVRDPYTHKTWKPQNYEKGGFEGPITIRQALTKSKNTVSVRLIERITPQSAIDFARRAGIRSNLPDNLTLALGTGEVTMLEIANAYATLHSLGKYAEPQLILKVVTPAGKVVEEHQAAFEETLPPAVAYLATSLMRSVVEEGTAMAVRELNRPAVGKTGTASEYRDAWFSGYTVQYVASAWVGFDNHDSLGGGETGGHAALPIWLGFMKPAHQGLPEREFPMPTGVTMVRVDPVTGLLAGDAVPGRMEPFLEGTAPTAMAPSPGQVDPNSGLFLEDQRRGGM